MPAPLVARDTHANAHPRTVTTRGAPEGCPISRIMEAMGGSERRAAPRLRTKLRVGIAGIDKVPVIREGDLSVSGVYFDLDVDVGDVGTLHQLVLVSEDGEIGVTVLARLVRLMSTDDFWRGRIVEGAAFQFLSEERGGDATPVPAPESPRILELVKYATAHALDEDASLEHRWEGTVEGGEGRRAARVESLSLQGMVLDTDFPLPVGEVVTVELPDPESGHRLAFKGRAIESDATIDEDGRGSYRTDVRFDERRLMDEAGEGRTISDALDLLVRRTLPPAPGVEAATGGAFSGDLSHVSLMSVFTLCTLERLTGVLYLTRGDDEVRAYFRQGRIVDVDVDAGPKEATDAGARELLIDVVGWGEGHFRVSVEDVDRPDRIDRDTNALLIDVARERDERGLSP